MKIFGKTISYWIEKIGGLIIGLIVSLIVLFCIKFDINSLNAFINSIPTISICIFGFLLTMLSIILQSNSPTIKTFLSETHKKTYKKFVLFSQRVVLLSLTITIFSLMIGNIKIPTSYFSECVINLFNNVLIFVHITILICLFFDTYQFINMFFNLMKNIKHYDKN